MQRDPKGPARSLKGAARAADAAGVAKRRPRPIQPMPEVATAGRRDVPSGGTWTVESGAACRGEAWTSTVDEHRVMRAPVDATDLGKLVRAHEMTHARYSPRFIDAETAMRVGGTGNAIAALPDRAMTCAEEYRVNEIARRAGFNMDDLADGSERTSGRRAASGLEWNEMVAYAAALATSSRTRGKALTAFLRGVKEGATDPDLADASVKVLQALATALAEYVRGVLTSDLASTSPGWVAGCACACCEGTVRGPLGDNVRRRTWGLSPGECSGCGAPFVMVATGYYTTVMLASIVAHFMSADPATPPDDDDDDGDPIADAERRPLPNGDVDWPRVHVHPDRPTVPVRGRIIKRRRSDVTGRSLRHPDRLMTDPARRAFGRKLRQRGGVVVVDMSGSMSDVLPEVPAMLDAAPGALILGYSGHDGDDGTPNVWVLAENGKRVARTPHTCGSNGVDGSALRLGIKLARRGDPVVFVSDGECSYGEDGGRDLLDVIRRHKVRMVATPRDAVGALRGVWGHKVYGRVASAAATDAIAAGRPMRSDHRDGGVHV